MTFAAPASLAARRVAALRRIPGRGITALISKPTAARALSAPVRSTASASGTVAAKWQVDPTSLRQLVKLVTGKTAPALHGFGAYRGLGALGLSPQAASGAAAIGSAAAPAAGSAIAGIVGMSSIAGPIGIAAGVVIAIAISLFKKNYFNVPQANALCAQEKQMVQSYIQIQGYVAGRALGLSTMEQVFHGMVGDGMFPMNTKQFCFHEGCIQCVGDGSWVDATLGSCPQHNNCLGDALKQYNAQRASVPAGTPDAIYFVDQIYLPMNSTGNPPWITDAVSKSAEVHQMFYDLADAYLAKNVSGTTPYVEYPQQQIAASATAGAEGAPPAATNTTTGFTLNPVATPGTSQTGSAAMAPAPVSSTALPTGWTQVGTDPSTGAPIIQQAGNSQLYEYVNGAITPYSPTGVVAGQPTTGGMDANTVGLIQSMLAQGASQTQAYTSALQSLASQGVNTASPAVQAQVSSAVQDPNAALASIKANEAGMSTPEILMLVALAGGLLFFGKGAMKFEEPKAEREKHHDR